MIPDGARFSRSISKVSPTTEVIAANPFPAIGIMDVMYASLDLDGARFAKDWNLDMTTKTPRFRASQLMPNRDTPTIAGISSIFSTSFVVGTAGFDE